MMEGWAPAYNLTSHWHGADITLAVIDIFRIESDSKAIIPRLLRLCCRVTTWY